MGHRRDRLDGRMLNQTVTRKENSLVKEHARDRRTARMIEVVKKGTLPFTPDVMSWLSLKLDKKSSKITADDLKKIL